MVLMGFRRRLSSYKPVSWFTDFGIWHMLLFSKFSFCRFFKVSKVGGSSVNLLQDRSNSFISRSILNVSGSLNNELYAKYNLFSFPRELISFGIVCIELKLKSKTSRLWRHHIDGWIYSWWLYCKWSSRKFFSFESWKDLARVSMVRMVQRPPQTCVGILLLVGVFVISNRLKVKNDWS